MNFPAIPENLEALDTEALTALRAELRAAGLAIVEKGKTDRLSDEDLANARLAKDTVAQIGEVLAAQAAAAAELSDIEDALADDEDEDDTEDADEPALDDESDEGAESEDDTEDAESDEDDTEVTASVTPVRAKAGSTAKAAPKSSKPPATLDAQAQRWTSMAGVNGFAVGDTFENHTDIGQALLARWDDIRGSGTEKLAVAKIEARNLEATPMTPGLQSFVDVEESITAGMDCVPREPIYDVGCDSSVARPFANSLPNRRAPRGGYSVYPSPMLADVSNEDGNGDGTGQWVRADDAVDSGSVKAACAVIPCGTPDNYDIYGVYRCMTVRNLHQMTHPELVAAFLNKLGALWARFAEVTLLEAALDSPNVIDITGDVTANLGATSNILDNLIQAAAVYTEQERYEDGIRFGVWLQRWVAVAIVRDWLRAPRYNPSITDLVVARSEINAAFAKAGFNVHWVYDTPSGWNAVPTQAAGALQELPTGIDMLIGREGNMARMDEGSMTIGVTNKTPWDKDDMARNQFTMFWESYEGLIDYGCPSYQLSLAGVIPNGLINFIPQSQTAS